MWIMQKFFISGVTYNVSMPSLNSSSSSSVDLSQFIVLLWLFIVIILLDIYKWLHAFYVQRLCSYCMFIVIRRCLLAFSLTLAFTAPDIWKVQTFAFRTSSPTPVRLKTKTKRSSNISTKWRHTDTSTIYDATSSTRIDFRHVSQTSSLNFFPKMSSIGFSSLRLSSMIVLSSSHNLVWYLKVTCTTTQPKYSGYLSNSVKRLQKYFTDFTFHTLSVFSWFLDNDCT